MSYLINIRLANLIAAGVMLGTILSYSILAIV